MKKIKAVIENASIHKISDLFRRKPRGLQFNDTDALVVTAKTEDRRTVRETFYFCLKPDGTFNAETISRNGSRARRQRLAAFLRYYKIAESAKGYNIKEGIEGWKGKEVEVVSREGWDSIYIP
jgi:hypothetical protein